MDEENKATVVMLDLADIAKLRRDQENMYETLAHCFKLMQKVDFDKVMEYVKYIDGEESEAPMLDLRTALDLVHSYQGMAARKHGTEVSQIFDNLIYDLSRSVIEKG